MLPEHVLEKFRGKRVLVTGGTGLVGRQVVKLIQGHAEVISVSLAPSLPEWADGPLHLIRDLRDPEICKDITRGQDYVFHLAGLKGSLKDTVERPADYLVPMLQFNANMLEACRQAGVGNVVFASSIGAYDHSDLPLRESQAWVGTPMDRYPGWAKRMGELHIRAYFEQYAISWTAVRLAAVYGPGDRLHQDAMVIPALMHKIFRGDNPVEVWGDGRAVRDFIYSRDAAEGLLLAACSDEMLLNIGSGRGYSIRELVETLQKVHPFEARWNADQPQGFSRRVLDISRVQALGFSPSTSLEAGLRATWQALQEKKHASARV